ncbi:MAG TPA: SAM-dependent methyltransferase [Streptosporangiaceae bacterium]|jgi:O-methyltransferase involved in polyketide biosynthesis
MSKPESGAQGMADQVPPGVDATRPSPARIYDFMLGGTNNFAVDRDALARAIVLVPELHDIAWANRGFHQRSARWIAEQGVRQFIDLGSGLPTLGNTHEVVYGVAADARVVYVDVDPMVAVHSKELLAGDGRSAVVTADLRDPDGVLGDPVVASLIDFAEPVGLLMTAVLHFVADGSDPWRLVARYMAALAPGSYLALSHATADKLPPAAAQSARDTYANATEQMHLRPRAEVERLFAGLELVPPYQGAEPGLVHVGLWGCDDPELADSDGSRWEYAAVARRP